MRIQYDRRQVDNAVKWIKLYNRCAENWTEDFIRESIMSDLRRFRSSTLDSIWCMGYILIADRSFPQNIRVEIAVACSLGTDYTREDSFLEI